MSESFERPSWDEYFMLRLNWLNYAQIA